MATQRKQKNDDEPLISQIMPKELAKNQAIDIDILRWWWRRKKSLSDNGEWWECVDIHVYKKMKIYHLYLTLLA